MSDALLAVEGRDGALDDASEVESDAVGGLGLVQVGASSLESFAQGAELRFQRLGDQGLVETAFVRRHRRDSTAPRGGSSLPALPCRPRKG